MPGTNVPGANQMAAQMVAGRTMQGGGPPPDAMGGGPPVDPQVVEEGRELIYKLTDIITSDPNVMLALKDDLVGFGMTIKQFAGMGGGQPEQGPPGMGAGGPPPGMGPPQGGPPMGGGPPPGGMGGGGMPPMGA